MKRFNIAYTVTQTNEKGTQTVHAADLETAVVAFKSQLGGWLLNVTSVLLVEKELVVESQWV